MTKTKNIYWSIKDIYRKIIVTNFQKQLIYFNTHMFDFTYNSLKMGKQVIDRIKNCDLESFQIVDGNINWFTESTTNNAHEYEKEQSSSPKRQTRKKKNIKQSKRESFPENIEADVSGVKDLGERVCQRIKILLKKYLCQSEYDQIIKELKKQYKKQISGIKGMEILFRCPKLRQKISWLIVSGAMKREIVCSRKRCKINQKVKTNSMRNQLKYYNFIIFAFLQGGVDNLSTLRYPISNEKMKVDLQMQNKQNDMTDTGKTEQDIFNVLGIEQELSFEPIFQNELKYINNTF